jgi:C-3',4' desaturase CrtD
MMPTVAIIGAGMAGMATAARLQARGFSTFVLEAHTKIGGCAGYFRRRGFAFDVGATTLVDFEAGGVGAQLLESIGMGALEGEALAGYQAWLPDRTVMLHRDPAQWSVERLRALGDTPKHRAFWCLMDELAGVFWKAARRGVKLPMHTPADVTRNLRALDLGDLPLARYLTWTMGDALRHFGLRNDKPLAALLAMLIEDTVHSTLDDAPLINAALGITIRGAGLSRHRGGMWGFWRRFAESYRRLGGDLHVGCRVENVSGQHGSFTIKTTRGQFEADQVVCAVPATLAAQIAPLLMRDTLQPYLQRDAQSLGGAAVVFLGVPEGEVSGQTLTHHQVLHDYDQPLGNGNNLFISVSAPGDTESAPFGCRAVMISTHCALEPWENLSGDAYAGQKQRIGEHLIGLARQVYPQLGTNSAVYAIGTPRTYAHFTGRAHVGGTHQTLHNSNQHATPYDIGAKGLWLVGESTWPGLGTVACVLGSQHVADGVERLARPISNALPKSQHTELKHHASL